MNTLATLVLLSWIPVSIAVFASMQPRRALLTCYFVGWFFLPNTEWGFSGLPQAFVLWKFSAITVGAMLGILLFDSARLTRFRARAFDLPLVVWCLVPFATSISNGLGLWDGFSEMVDRMVQWGLPYLAGRLYFKDSESLQDLAIAVFAFALIYVPLCLFEIKMSPQLHKMTYGAHAAWGGARLGGWRPSVYLRNGLALGMWMSTASLVALWTTRAGTIKRLMGLPANGLLAVLLMTTLLCRSLGALGLFLLAVGTLWLCKVTRTALPLVVLIAVPLTYISVRATGLWSGDEWVDAVAEYVDEDRAWSLQYRLLNENVLAEHALKRPAFGWGGWNRSKVFNEILKKEATSDGMWIIALGKNGLVGLSALIGSLLLPAMILVARVPVRNWTRPEYAPAVALSLALLIYCCDCCLNAEISPYLMLFAGGVLGTLTSPGAKTVRREPTQTESSQGEAVSAGNRATPIAAAASRIPPECS